MYYGATVGAIAANSNLIKFKKITLTPVLNKSYHRTIGAPHGILKIYRVYPYTIYKRKN